MNSRVLYATQDRIPAASGQADTGDVATATLRDEPDDPRGYRSIGVRSTGVVATTLASYRRRGGGGSSRRGDRRGSPGKKGLLSEAEIAAIEEEHPDGLTVVQVVEIFASRAVRFSEASFRKYVQQGLLPRSRRVGRKGKHRGSMGLYPVKTVRRINEIKRLMAEGYTIEEIQHQVLRFKVVMEQLEEGFSELFSRLEGELAAPRFDTRTRRSVKREIAEAREVADELMARLGELSSRVAQPRGDEYRSSGAAGSAEDLL